MLYQNDLKPLVVTTTTQAFAIYATVKANDTILGDLLAFPLINVCKYYYDSLLRRLKIQEDLPDFQTKYRITKPNIIVETIVDGQTFTEVLTCGTTFPSSNRLTNNQKRTTLDSPFQVVYFIKDAVFAHLFGSVNGGAYTDLGLIKVLDVATKGAFLTINYHQYYAELGANEFDIVSFKFDKLPFRETIKLDAIYTDFPFILVMRNQYSFFDTFRFFGNQENTLDFQSNTIEGYSETRTVYNETIEKVSVQTGLLELKEKAIIAENLKNLDLFQYKNGTLYRLTSEMKSINKLTTKDAQDTLKLDFRYAFNTRRYL